MAFHGATKVSPYQLVYGRDVVLPWELKTRSRRTSVQDQLSVDDYSTMMKEELEDLAGNRLRALENIEKNKKRIARWYDKKVKVKEFAEGDLIWKLILPIGSRDPKYGKWSLSYGPPWAHYLGGYQDRLLGGPLGLPGLRCTAPDGVKHKDYKGEVLGWEAVHVPHCMEDS
jgi:hypothetical protein